MLNHGFTPLKDKLSRIYSFSMYFFKKEMGDLINKPMSNYLSVLIKTENLEYFVVYHFKVKKQIRGRAVFKGKKTLIQ